MKKATSSGRTGRRAVRAAPGRRRGRWTKAARTSGGPRPARAAGRLGNRRPGIRWETRAFNDGKREGADLSGRTFRAAHREINRRWNAWAQRMHFRPRSWERYRSVADCYMKGCCSGLNLDASNRLLWPTARSSTAVVSVRNEEATLPAVLQQLERLPLDEMIVIVNGSKDNSFAAARKSAGARIVYYPEPLGHDVGRSIGAKLAQTEFILFLDGDIPFQAEQLFPFVRHMEDGADVVLNDLSRLVGKFSQRDSVTIVKEFLNRTLGRRDLLMNSLTAVPHILTRKAVETIGAENLAVPPVAQALAIRGGLSIKTAPGVDVISGNKVRKDNSGVGNPVSDMIVGDHLEALSTVMKLQGERLDYLDHIRKRWKIGGA